MLCKNWVVSKLDKDAVSKISEKFEIDPLLAILLQIRNLTDDNTIKEILYEDYTPIDPIKISDMDKAIERISKAVNKFEKICVYGDYDADGVTATTLVYSYLNALGANVIYYIPDRHVHGYGLNIESIDCLKSEDVSLIITVDNGIAAIDEVNHANSLGIDVVITDHHEVPQTIPDAIAVVNPRRSSSDENFQDLSGVGVAFKLICALEKGNSSEADLFSEYADLVAIGTIGDIVPLRGENRKLVREGMKCLKKRNRLGLKYLLDILGYGEKNLMSTDVSFCIVPRINACGRLKHADVAVKLLLSETDEEARCLAEELNELNTQRKEIELDILKQVEDFLKRNPSRVLDRVIVVEGEGFHPGVIGIVASKVVDKYSKPCIIISKSGDVGRASGRSVEGFSIYDAAKRCSDYFLKFGGHHMAIGFDIPSEKINDFIEDINKVAFEVEDIPVPCLKLDCKLRPESISLDFINQINRLEPFGSCNPSPLFGLFGMTIEHIQPVGGGKHLKLTLSRDEIRLTAMKFYTTFDTFQFKEQDVVDVAVTLNKDFFRQVESLSIFITDIKMSGISRDEVISELKLYETIKRTEPVEKEKAAQLVPTREEIGKVYKFLKKSNGWDSSLENLWYRLKENEIGICKLNFIIDIMNELGLIIFEPSPTKYSISMNPVETKVDLYSSYILTKLNDAGGAAYD